MSYVAVIIEQEGQTGYIENAANAEDVEYKWRYWGDSELVHATLTSINTRVRLAPAEDYSEENYVEYDEELSVEEVDNELERLASTLKSSLSDIWDIEVVENA